MSTEDFDDFSHLSLQDLFRIEVESQASVITDGLLKLERDPAATGCIEALMRGAHSLKGAARIVNRESAIRLAHAMEDCFLAAQRGQLVLQKKQIDLLLRAVDLLTRSAQTAETAIEEWQAQHRSEIQAIVTALSATALLPEPNPPAPIDRQEDLILAASPDAVEPENGMLRPPVSTHDNPAADLSNRLLRIAPESFNRLLGISGEMVVASRWLNEFAGDLLRIRKLQNGISTSVSRLSEFIAGSVADELLQTRLDELRAHVGRSLDTLVQKTEEFESFDARFAGLSKRLYQGVLECRMRPFSDGIRGFPRMVRDVAHALAKQVKLEVVGGATPVDRDVLERLEAPLGHLLRNAIDHGIELPADRRQSGKPDEGTIRLEARHSSGVLFVTVADDGRGLDLEQLRQALVQKNLATIEIAEKFSEAELLDFLFLPGFTMKESVTEISGRGVGLDVVQVMAKEVGGNIRAFSKAGRGLTVELRLPLTLSVVRALLVDIGGEPYAFPLARITSVLTVPKDKIESAEGREHFTFGAQQIGLVAGQQLLGTEIPVQSSDKLSVVVLGSEAVRYGVVVDRFLGEQELVVRPLDRRLGVVKDISAAALLSNQSPVLIVDVDGMILSIESLVSGNRLANVRRSAPATGTTTRKRVLVVEDSLTVRELERKLLNSHGYEVDVAVDGMEGWNAVRTGNYDLVITDVDMPRMDGIELIRLIRKDLRLRSLPVMVVSYKDREDDRRRGLYAGADYYVAKGSFHHETLLEAVGDLIGKPSQ